jgi:hypothetical protein
MIMMWCCMVCVVLMTVSIEGEECVMWMSVWEQSKTYSGLRCLCGDDCVVCASSLPNATSLACSLLEISREGTSSPPTISSALAPQPQPRFHVQTYLFD